MSIFEVDGGQLEHFIIFPCAQTDQVVELLVGEEDVQHTLVNDVLSPDGFLLFLDFFPFLLVLVLHLKYFLGGMLLLSPSAR